MGLARERIVPAAGKGAWLYYAGVGFAIGALYGFSSQWFHGFLIERASLAGIRFVLAERIVSGLMCVLVLAPLAGVLRVAQRWGAVMGFSLAFVLALELVSEGRTVLARPDGGAWMSDWMDGEFRQGIYIFIPGFLLAAVILRTLWRAMVVRTVEQGSDDCAWCGYTRGSAAITRCPECGREAATAPYRMHRYIGIVTCLARRWKLLVFIACATLVALSIQPIFARTFPALEFYARFPGAIRERAGGRELTVWLAESPDSSRGLAVRYMLAEGRRPDRMSVDVAEWAGGSLSIGSGHVIARLSPEQGRWVLGHGLPEGLVRALYAEANEIDWTAESTARGEYPVDPAPCFPN